MRLESLRQCRPECETRFLVHPLRIISWSSIKRERCTDLHNFFEELGLCHRVPLHPQNLLQRIDLSTISFCSAPFIYPAGDQGLTLIQQLATSSITRSSLAHKTWTHCCWFEELGSVDKRDRPVKLIELFCDASKQRSVGVGFFPLQLGGTYLSQRLLVR